MKKSRATRKYWNLPLGQYVMGKVVVLTRASRKPIRKILDYYRGAIVGVRLCHFDNDKSATCRWCARVKRLRAKPNSIIRAKAGAAIDGHYKQVNPKVEPVE